MTPVMKSKQEKVASKIVDILQQDSPVTQCSSNCKDTEIQWLILFQFQSLADLIYPEWDQRNRNCYNQPQLAHNSS